MWRVVTSSWALVALLAASGCAAGGEDPPPPTKPAATPSRVLDQAALDACTKFARWQADGAKSDTQVDTAMKVHALASNSNIGTIDDKAELLFRVSKQGRNETWTLAADSFAYECQNLGWTADDAR